MYTETQNWALGKFDELVDKLGSQNKACAQVGIAPTIMSPLKKGIYAGDANAQLEKLISYFKVKEEAAASPAQQLGFDYVPTSISSKVYEVIRNCQLTGGLAIACGDAGIGKTKAAKRFVADHPNDAIYISVNPCFRNIKSLLKMLCSKLSVTERTLDEMWFGITNKLRDGMIIIVDEAQHLAVKTIEVLRAFSDHFSDRGQTLGVAFIGNTETVNNFGGKKKAKFAQISNRTRQRKLYLTTHIKKDDIEMLFPALNEERQIEFLLGIARTVQAIRGAVNLYVNAADNNNTSYADLVAMAKGTVT